MCDKEVVCEVCLFESVMKEFYRICLYFVVIDIMF